MPPDPFLDRRVVVLAPTQRDAEATVALLTEAGVAADACATFDRAIAEVHRGAAAFLLPEEALDAEGCRQVAALVADQPPWSDLPLLLLTYAGADSAAAVTATETLGNVTLLERPLRIGTLISAVRTALRARDRQYQIREHLAERASTEQALQRAHDSLEVRVVERTRQVQSLLDRLVSVQEEERRRIARNIHDQLGQHMTALRMHLTVLASRVEHEPALAEFAGRTQAIAEELDHSLDCLTWELRPAALDHLGLAVALRDLVTGWSERFGIPVEVDVAGAQGLRLSPDREANLYRLAQEALHNVYKHAHASRVAVSLDRRGDDLLFVVEDDGCGFVVGEVHPRYGSSGLGLVSMRERAAIIGGRLTIASEPGTGTTLFVRVPLAATVHNQV